MQYQGKIKKLNEREELVNMKLKSKTNKKRAISLIMTIALLLSLLGTIVSAFEQDYEEVANFDEVYVANVDDAEESNFEDTQGSEPEYDESYIEDTERCDTDYDANDEENDGPYIEASYTYDAFEEFRAIEEYYSVAEVSATDIHLQLGTASGAPGGTILLPIDVMRNVQGVGAIVYYVEFDATRLELISVIAGDVLNIPMGPPLGNNPLRIVSIDLSGAGAAAGVTGTLATVEFRIRDNAPSGETTVGLRTNEASGSINNLGERTHSATGGSVIVTDSIEPEFQRFEVRYEPNYGHTTFPQSQPASNTISTVPAIANHYVGLSVTVAPPLTTTSTTQVQEDGTYLSGIWTFTGWTTTDAIVTGNAFTMPANEVVFTGDWTFTATVTENEPDDGVRLREINITYSLLNDGNMVNVGTRQYTHPEGYRFNFSNVLDRNTLPGENVYVFEGWRVFVGGIYSPNYLADLNVNNLRGTFTVPHVNVDLYESFTTFTNLNETVGAQITLHAVWSLYEADDNCGVECDCCDCDNGVACDCDRDCDCDNAAGTGGGASGAGGDSKRLPQTNVESNVQLFAGLLLLVLMIGTAVIIELNSRRNQKNN